MYYDYISIHNCCIGPASRNQRTQIGSLPLHALCSFILRPSANLAFLMQRIHRYDVGATGVSCSYDIQHQPHKFKANQTPTSIVFRLNICFNQLPSLNTQIPIPQDVLPRIQQRRTPHFQTRQVPSQPSRIREQRLPARTPIRTTPFQLPNRKMGS